MVSILADIDQPEYHKNPGQQVSNVHAEETYLLIRTSLWLGKPTEQIGPMTKRFDMQLYEAPVARSRRFQQIQARVLIFQTHVMVDADLR